MANDAGAGRATAQKGSIPYIRTTNVAHWVEQQTYNLPVAGSNPAVYRLQRDSVKNRPSASSGTLPAPAALHSSSCNAAAIKSACADDCKAAFCFARHGIECSGRCLA
jgi:hypothetical protein